MVILDDDKQDREETMRLDDVDVQPIETVTNEPPKQVTFATPENEFEPVAEIDDPLTRRYKEVFLSWHVKLGHTPFKNI